MGTPTSFIPPNQNSNWESSTSPVRSGHSVVPISAAPEVDNPLRGAPTIKTRQPQIGSTTWGTQWRRKSSAVQLVSGLNKWEGKILSVEDGFFTAELCAIDREAPSITADFDLELLGSDSVHAAPGDVFYLSVRTVKSPGTRPTLAESLRLRRLGRITHKDVQDVYARADARMEHLEQIFD